MLLIAGEDDPGTMLRPRLEAAGADLNRVKFVVRDEETQTGIPNLPKDRYELRNLIEETEAVLVVIDPWLSVVAPNIQVKDTQQARIVLDPLSTLARETGAAILIVGHTNRSDSDLTPCG